MNQFFGLSFEAVTAEIEYRRGMLAVSAPRRLRRARRAVR
jgi:hypothetical protein